VVAFLLRADRAAGGGAYAQRQEVTVEIHYPDLQTDQIEERRNFLQFFSLIAMSWQAMGAGKVLVRIARLKA
jgi:hypothetical protein